jgi:hypothetical protein
MPVADPAGNAPSQASTRPPLASLEAGLRRIGNWLILGVDAVGKRAACRCDCGRVAELSLQALEAGSIPLCDCRRRPAGAAISASADFAADVAALEGNDATYRRNKMRRP